jgi:predicted nucleotidyltransferase
MMELYQTLRSIVREKLGYEADLVMYGSAVNGLGLTGGVSDLDLTVMFEGSSDNHETILKKVLDALLEFELESEELRFFNIEDD